MYASMNGVISRDSTTLLLLSATLCVPDMFIPLSLYYFLPECAQAVNPRKSVGSLLPSFTSNPRSSIRVPIIHSITTSTLREPPEAPSDSPVPGIESPGVRLGMEGDLFKVRDFAFRDNGEGGMGLGQLGHYREEW